MAYKRKTCICGHNKKAHSYFWGCNKCKGKCASFKRKNKGQK